jgi:hypothetical protein
MGDAGGGSVEAGFRRENFEFLGPRLGPGTPPDASGSLCCAFCGYFQPRSSILNPFRDTFWYADFPILGNQHLHRYSVLYARPVQPLRGEDFSPPAASAHIAVALARTCVHRCCCRC